MSDDNTFAERIRQHYSEGLTGIFAVGGTRTTYILENNRHKNDPGEITDFQHYADTIHGRYHDLITMFTSLGGQNIIIPVLAYQRFYEKGAQYTAFIARQTLDLINEKSLMFYRENEVDPYFIGIDTLRHLPQDHPGYDLGERLYQFQQEWAYVEGRPKVLWEIAPISLFSFWQAHQVMGAEAEAELMAEMQSTTDMRVMFEKLYAYYARAAYGTDVPLPHFYVGTNRNGDFKLRSMLPIALSVGEPCRLFYTPYPSLFITKEALKTILEDLMYEDDAQRNKQDYSGRYTAEMAQAEYERIMALSRDPNTIMGLMGDA